jgi:hypothetical protein
VIGLVVSCSFLGFSFLDQDPIKASFFGVTSLVFLGLLVFPSRRS